jgi:hypothetical protein
MRSRFAGLIVLVAFVAGAGLPGQIFAEGASSPHRNLHSKLGLARQTTTFGTLGIVAGQTVRVSGVRQPDEDQRVTICHVELNIFDIHGNRQAAVSKNLDPGKGAFLDLARADIVPPLTEARAQIYAVVDVTSNSKDGKSGCHVAMSIEIFDQADGRSRIYQGSVEVRDGEPRNLAPPGSQAQCFGSCALEDASCPASFECWANPINQEYMCCNGRP